MDDGPEIICLICSQHRSELEKCFHFRQPALIDKRFDFTTPDLFPEMICSICLAIMDYAGPKSGFRGCMHNFHFSCLEEWLKTFEGEKTKKPTCPTCRGGGKDVDMIVSYENQTVRVPLKPSSPWKPGDGVKYCTVCLLDWNTEFMLSCSDCQGFPIHTYCLERPIKMNPNIPWRCRSCWLAKTLSFNVSGQLSLVSFLNATCGIRPNTFRMLPWMKKRIAIIGSGPCGLAAATQLLTFGHSVDVFEKNPKCGGLLREGILTMKISRFTVDAILQKLANGGVQFFCNRYIRNYEYRVFLKTYDAIIICTGAPIIRSSLPDDIHDIVGVFSVTKFFSFEDERQETLEELNSAGKQIIYITNNNISDSQYISFLGKRCKNFGVIELLPQPKKGQNVDSEFPCPKSWPCFMKSKKDIVVFENNNKNEGVLAEIIIKTIKTRRTLKGQQVFEGLEIAYVSWNSSDSKFVEIPGSDRIIEADLLIVSNGCIESMTEFFPDFCLNNDTSSFQTGTDKVFAAGDCIRGETTLSQAFLSGFCVAQQVQQFCLQCF